MIVSKTTMANGITVISQDYAHLETVALGVWTKAGARDERLEQNGIAHLLEHMAFKGTNQRSARQIAEEIEQAGGDLNAATSMETTAYTARVLKQDWPTALDVLSDIVCDPVFEADELAREKDVVLQEIAAANDTPDDVVYDLGHEIAFRDQAIGRPILGIGERVQNFTREHLHEFRHDHYGGQRMVVAAAGRIDHEALVAQAAEKFSSLPHGNALERPTARFSGGMQTAEKPLDQTHILMSFPCVGYCHDDIYATQILSIILGGGMSSRLFQNVREQQGLCYAVYAHVSAFQDAGLLSVYAGTAPEKTGELVTVASDTLLSMTEKAGQVELDRAKNQIKAALVMSLESTTGRADQLARQYLAFGENRDIAQTIKKIEAVELEDIARLGRDLFTGGKLSFSAVGDLAKLPTFDNVVSRFG